MKEILFSKKSRDFLKAISEKHRRQLARRIEELKTNVRPNDSRKLTGYDYYRIDSGEYRIIYHFDDELAYIVLVGKRNDSEVYKRLERS